MNKRDDIAVELMRLRHAVSEMREWIVPRLNAMDAQIDALLPHEPPPERPIDYKEWRNEIMAKLKRRK